MVLEVPGVELRADLYAARVNESAKGRVSAGPQKAGSDSQPAQPPSQLLAGKKRAEGELLGEERGAPGNGERGTQTPPASRKATLQRRSH